MKVRYAYVVLASQAECSIVIIEGKVLAQNLQSTADKVDCGRVMEEILRYINVSATRKLYRRSEPGGYEGQHFLSREQRRSKER
jgi:hypothetical protein